MNGSIIRVLIITGVFIAGPAQADIYQWTDKNGVKHFTNYKPPAHATILMKTKEVPYDEAADRARIEADSLTGLNWPKERPKSNSVKPQPSVKSERPNAMPMIPGGQLTSTWMIRSMIAGTTAAAAGAPIVMATRVTNVHITAIIPPAFTGRIATASITTNAKITKKAATDTGKIFTANHTAIQSIRVSKDTGHRITCDPAVDAPTAAITATPGAAAGWAGATLAGAPSDAIANPHLDSLIQTDSPKAYFSIITSSQME